MNNLRSSHLRRDWRIKAIHFAAIVFAMTLAMSLLACGGKSESSGSEKKEPTSAATSPQKALESVLSKIESKDKRALATYLVDLNLSRAKRSTNHFMDKFVEETATGLKFRGVAADAGIRFLQISPEEAQKIGVRQFWIDAVFRYMSLRDRGQYKYEDLMWSARFGDLSNSVPLEFAPSDGVQPYRDMIEKNHKDGIGKIHLHPDLRLGGDIAFENHDGRWFVSDIFKVNEAVKRFNAD